MTLLGPDPALTAATALAENFLGRHESAQRRLARAAGCDEDAEAVTILLARVAGAFFTLDLDARPRAQRGRRWRSPSGSATRC